MEMGVVCLLFRCACICYSIKCAKLRGNLSALGLSPRKELLRALLAGDEEKAIQVYVLVTNGKSLEEDLYPSLPLVESTLQTPMHLVHTSAAACVLPLAKADFPLS